MDKILYTAFRGKNNSSHILLDKIHAKDEDKLYLKNSYEDSVNKLIDKIKNDSYDLIISFGRCPLSFNTIKLEKCGTFNDEIITTDCKLVAFKKMLEDNGYNVIISSDAGNYLCNNLYYYGLKYIKENNLKCLMLFIHIPDEKYIDDINKLADLFKC